ncbi:hypothetical protein [Bradyrhizobium sp. SSUT77]|uniref:hypothetical protein n=1 Tax=Bradyrhizobium sp. SSUT77 TaxID=3040603 RepID=UPI00244B2D30|nr:hypothetical protein [Bradyrhizobium sp. SSUT77]MDH2344013.1 hypothetical protein [Bradyrhizobium sp. SSUT77]
MLTPKGLTRSTTARPIAPKPAIPIVLPLSEPSGVIFHSARPDIVDTLLETEDRRKDIFGDRIGRNAATDRDHGTIEQPRRKEIDARRCSLDPAEAKRPAHRLLRGRAVPARQRPRQQHVGLGGDLPLGPIGRMIDDQRTGPVIGKGSTNFGAELIDDDRRPHAHGSALVFNAGSVHVATFMMALMRTC